MRVRVWWRAWGADAQPRRARRAWLMSLVLLLIVAGCALPDSQPASSDVPIGHAAQLNTPAATNTPANAGVALAPASAYLQWRAAHGLDDWTRSIGLPHNRIVVLYLLDPPQTPNVDYDRQLLAQVRQQTDVYNKLDPSHPAVPAIDVVTPIIEPYPGPDGTYLQRASDAEVEHYADLANANHMLFFVDMQLGRSTLEKEMQPFWKYLERPGFHIAVDPEFDMGPNGGIPNVYIGHTYAAEINWLSDRLNTLVATHNLPPKILLIYQFRDEVAPDWQNIKLMPNVSLVNCFDGVGMPAPKITGYTLYDKIQHIQYPGFKVFYGEPQPMSEAQVLALDPPPLLVEYQ